MPRKQRFKPSRKPKQPQATEVTDMPRIDPSIEPQRTETGQPARSSTDSPPDPSGYDGA